MSGNSELTSPGRRRFLQTAGGLMAVVPSGAEGALSRADSPYPAAPAKPAAKNNIPVIVGFSGCPGGAPGDKMPNWATYRWPPEYHRILEYQWNEVVIPFGKQAARYAREHGIHASFGRHHGVRRFLPRAE